MALSGKLAKLKKKAGQVIPDSWEDLVADARDYIAESARKAPKAAAKAVYETDTFGTNTSLKDIRAGYDRFNRTVSDPVREVAHTAIDEDFDPVATAKTSFRTSQQAGGLGGAFRKRDNSLTKRVIENVIDPLNLVPVVGRIGTAAKAGQPLGRAAIKAAIIELGAPAAGQVLGHEAGRRVGGDTGAMIGETAGLLAGGFGPNLLEGKLPKAAPQRGLLPTPAAGIVPTDVARRLPGQSTALDARAQAAVRETPGAELVDDGIEIDLERWQHPKQGIRRTPPTTPTKGGGRKAGRPIFYSVLNPDEPSEFSPTFRTEVLGMDADEATDAAIDFGGTQGVQGRTLLRAPLIIEDDAGGISMTTAFDKVGGNSDELRERMADMVREAFSTWGLDYRPEAFAGGRVFPQVLAIPPKADEFRKVKADPAGKRMLETAVRDALEEMGGEPALAKTIIANAKDFNHLYFATQESIVGSAARKAGYDSIVTINDGGGDFNAPRIVEVADLREASYPTPEGGFTLRPEFQPRGVMGAVPTDRYYHGTSDTFDQPDPARFDANGLFGPGYYLTSDSRVASSYADQRAATAPPSPEMQQREIELQQAMFRAEEQRNQAHEIYMARKVKNEPGPGLYAQMDLDEIGFQREAAQRRVDAAREALMSFQREMDAARGGQQVRAVNVPRTLNLLDVEATLPAATVERIGAAVDPKSRLGRMVPRWRESGAIEHISGKTIYDTIREDYGAEPTRIVLHRAGYDGIRYDGGKRIPLKADDGSDILHTAILIFPESISKIQNALSGTPGGLLPATPGQVARTAGLGADALGTLGGAATGVGVSEVTAPDDERHPWRRRLVAAGLGAAGGRAAVRQLAGQSLGIDDITSAGRTRLKGARTTDPLALPDGRRYTDLTPDEVVRSYQQARGRGSALPPTVQSGADLEAMRNNLRRLAVDGEFGRMWYEESSQQILDAFGGDKDAAERFVQILAIYSNKTDVPQNTDRALRAWYQYLNGEAITAGMPDSNKAATRLLYEGIPWEGRKTNSFYSNLMLRIDPEKLAEEMPETAGRVVTADAHMMRAFGWPQDKYMSPNRVQYDLIERETARLADELGWEPQQVQAAIWVGQKAKTDALRFAKKTPEQVRQGAKTSYADVLFRDTAQLSWETASGATTDILPGFFRATPEQKAEYHAAKSAVLLDENGQDRIVKALNIPQRGAIQVAGAYEGQVAPGSQTMVAGARGPSTKGGKRAATIGQVDPGVATRLDAAEAIRAYLLRRDAAAWTAPVRVPGEFTKTETRAAQNAIDISVGHVLSEDEALRLAGAIRRAGLDAAIIATRDGAWVKNIGDTPNEQFVTKAVDALDGVWDTGVKVGPFIADGRYFENNWKEAPNGESYLDVARRSGAEDILRRLEDELGPSLRAVDADFAARYGWREGGLGLGHAAGLVGARPGAAAARVGPRSTAELMAGAPLGQADELPRLPDGSIDFDALRAQARQIDQAAAAQALPTRDLLGLNRAGLVADAQAALGGAAVGAGYEAFVNDERDPGDLAKAALKGAAIGAGGRHIRSLQAPSTSALGAVAQAPQAAQAAQQKRTLMGVAKATLDLGRQAMLSGDIGQFARIGVPAVMNATAAGKPIAGIEGVLKASTAAVNPAYADSYLRGATAQRWKNLAWDEDILQPEFTNLIQRLPGFGHLDRAMFQRFTPVLVSETAEAIYQGMKNSGDFKHMSDPEKMATIGAWVKQGLIGKSLDPQTNAGLRAVANFSLLSPRWTLGQLANVKALGATGPEGELARRFWATTAVFAIGTAVAANQALNGVSPLDSLNPTHKDSVVDPRKPRQFLAIRTPNGFSIQPFAPVLGVMRTLLRPTVAAGEAVAENGLPTTLDELYTVLGAAKAEGWDAARDYGLGRLSPHMRLANDLVVTGEDFSGNEIMTKEGLAGLAQAGEYAARQYAPIITQPFLEEQKRIPGTAPTLADRALETASGFIGLNVRTPSRLPADAAGELRSALRARGVEPDPDPSRLVGQYYDLNLDGDERAAFFQANPAVRRYLDERTKQFGETFNRPKGRKAVDTFRGERAILKSERDAALRQLEADGVSGDEYRRRRSIIQTRYRERLGGVQQMAFGTENPQEIDEAMKAVYKQDKDLGPVDAALDKLYDIQQTDDSIEARDAYFRERDAYLATLSDDLKEKMFQKQLAEAPTDTERRYLTAQRIMQGYYAMPKYRKVVKPEDEAAVDAALRRAGDLATYSGIPRRQAILLDTTTDKRVKKLALKVSFLGARAYNPERRKYLKSNPILSTFYSSLSAEQAAQLVADAA